MAKLNLVILFACCVFMSIWASPEGTTSSDPDHVVIFQQDVPNKRPNLPARYYLECHYGCGYMEFSIPAGFEYLIVSIRDGEYSVWEGMVSPDNPYTEIPDLSGEYTVVCTSDGNHTFVGTIYL